MHVSHNDLVLMTNFIHTAPFLLELQDDGTDKNKVRHIIDQKMKQQANYIYNIKAINNKL